MGRAASSLSRRRGPWDRAAQDLRAAASSARASRVGWALRVERAGEGAAAERDERRDAVGAVEVEPQRELERAVVGEEHDVGVGQVAPERLVEDHRDLLDGPEADLRDRGALGRRQPRVESRIEPRLSTPSGTVTTTCEPRSVTRRPSASCAHDTPRRRALDRVHAVAQAHLRPRPSQG